MNTVLYSNESSYYSMIARLVLAEKVVPYESHLIDIHLKLDQFKPEYLKIQPNMTVPVLDHNGIIINDSKDILFYVNKNFSGPDLMPSEDSDEIQRQIELHYEFSIEDFTMGKFVRQSPIARFGLNHGLKRAVRRCHQLIKNYPEFRVAVENKLELEKERVEHILSKNNNYAEMYQKAIDICDILEKKLGDHEYIASNKYSLADVVWTTFLARLHMAKEESLVNSHKLLHEYWEKMKLRPSFVKADIWTSMRISKILMILGSIFMR